VRTIALAPAEVRQARLGRSDRLARISPQRLAP
jgi:hypothetical protein